MGDCLWVLPSTFVVPSRSFACSDRVSGDDTELDATSDAVGARSSPRYRVRHAGPGPSRGPTLSEKERLGEESWFFFREIGRVQALERGKERKS